MMDGDESGTGNNDADGASIPRNQLIVVRKPVNVCYRCGENDARKASRSFSSHGN